MSDSRGDPRPLCRAAAIACVVLTLALGGAAAAQRPAGPVPPTFPSVTLPPAAAPAEPGIRVDQLGDVDPDAIGVLTRETGSLDRSLWRGADRARIARLVTALPDRATSPAVFGLTRRLLLSTLDVPEGPPVVPGLAAERVMKLSSMGAFRGAASLAGVLPVEARDGAVEQADLEARLLVNDNAGACATARAALDRHLEPIWLRSIAYCRLLAGDAEGAELAAGLARETAPDDMLFFALFERLAGRALADAPLPDGEAEAVSPLHLAMARTAGVPPPLRGEPDHRMAESIARSPSAPLAQRITAGERAAASATIEAGVLRAIYAAAAQAGEDGGSPAARAFRDLQIEAGERWAELLIRAFDAARDRIGPAAAAALLAPDLAGVEMRRASLVHVADAVRIALLAGDRDAAWSGYDALRARAGEDQRVAGELAALEPLMRIAAVDVDEDGHALAWLAEEAAGNRGDARQRRALMVLTLLRALDEGLPPAAYGVLAEAERTTVPALDLHAGLIGLDAALAGDRPGEALLHALILLDGGRRLGDPQVAGPAVAALRRIGLAAEARALALEAAIGAGA